MQIRNVTIENTGFIMPFIIMGYECTYGCVRVLLQI